MRVELENIWANWSISSHFAQSKSYLTTVVCTDMVDGILAAGKRQVDGYGNLISNKRDWTEQDEWSNCFIKNTKYRWLFP